MKRMRITRRRALGAVLSILFFSLAAYPSLATDHNNNKKKILSPRRSRRDLYIRTGANRKRSTKDNRKKGAQKKSSAETTQ